MEVFHGNVYIYIPCLIEGDSENFEAAKASSDPHDPSLLDFIDQMSSYSQSEIIDSMHVDLQRFSMGSLNLLCSDTAEVIAGEEHFETANWTLTIHKRTQLAFACIILHRVAIPATQLLDQISKEEVLFKNEKGDLENFENMLEQNFLIVKSGTIRACLSANEFNKPNEDEIQYYFACESYDSKIMGSKIRSPTFISQSRRNLAQYESSEIYAGYKSILRIDLREECKISGPTFASDCLFLFIVELLILKDAAVSRTHQKVIRGIAKSDEFSLGLVDNYLQEFSQTMPFWNLDIFRYSTAQQLANEIDVEFGTRNDLEKYLENQRFLEHQVSLKNALAAESENQILNTIAIFVFIFEAVPIAYFFVDRIIKGTLKFDMSLFPGIMSLSLVSLLLLSIIQFIKRRNQKRILYARE